MWSVNQRISEFMRIAFYNHLKFCEDFIVFFLGLYLKHDLGFFHAPFLSTSAESPWMLIHKVELPFYIKKYGPPT
jgi:hypothetical protein